MSRNLVPIVGIAFLDWKAVNILLLYFADFMLDLGACFAMLALLDPEARAFFAAIKSIKEWIRNIVGLLIAALFLGAAFAFVFGMPVYFALASESGNPFEDPRFREGLLLHLALSSWNFLLAYRFVSRASRIEPDFKVDRAVKGRFNYVTSRWLAVYVAGLVGFVFPPLMVAAYCAATIYFELNPRRAQEMLNSPVR